MFSWSFICALEHCRAVTALGFLVPVKKTCKATADILYSNVLSSLWKQIGEEPPMGMMYIYCTFASVNLSFKLLLLNIWSIFFCRCLKGQYQTTEHEIVCILLCLIHTVMNRLSFALSDVDTTNPLSVYELHPSEIGLNKLSQVNKACLR